MVGLIACLNIVLAMLSTLDIDVSYPRMIIFLGLSERLLVPPQWFEATDISNDFLWYA